MNRFARRILAATPLLALALAGCATVSGEAPSTAAPVAAAAQPTGTTPWGFPIYDIPADPAVRFGKLDNGLKFAVLKNATPRNTVAVRLGFDVGVIDETVTGSWLPLLRGTARPADVSPNRGSTGSPRTDLGIH